MDCKGILDGTYMVRRPGNVDIPHVDVMFSPRNGIATPFNRVILGIDANNANILGVIV